MGRRRGAIVLALAGLFAIGAFAIALVPFRDTLALPGESPDSFSLSCGAPVVAAVHGTSVARLGGVERTVTQYERRVITRDDPALVTVMCRRPARGRLLISIAGLGASALTLMFVRRRSRSTTLDDDEPMMADASTA